MCYGCFCTQATKNNACKKSESQKKHVTKKCVLQKNVCKENTIIKWPQNKKMLVILKATTGSPPQELERRVCSALNF